MRETWVRSLGREDPLEKEMATHSGILAWRIPWTKELCGLQSMGRKESDTTERLHFHFCQRCEDDRLLSSLYKNTVCVILYFFKTCPYDMLSHFSCVWLFLALWTVAHQASLSMDFSGKNTGVGCYFLLQGIFPKNNIIKLQYFNENFWLTCSDFILISNPSISWINFWQKTTKFCKAIILQLKNKVAKEKKKDPITKTWCSQINKN